MAQANLPIQYWGDALLTVTFVLNRVPSKLVSSTPYELWSGRKPNLKDLHPQGSAVYVHDTFHKFGKLGPRGKNCIFIRYSKNSKGYMFIGEDSNRRLTEIESCNITFLENHFSTKDDINKDHHLFEMDDDDETCIS